MRWPWKREKSRIVCLPDIRATREALVAEIEAEEKAQVEAKERSHVAFDESMKHGARAWRLRTDLGAIDKTLELLSRGQP